MPCARLPLLLAAVLGLSAGSALAANPVAFLPAGWSHAQINVRGHTFIYDRGRVTAATGSSLTLREPDGNVVTIQVSPTAVVRVNGRLLPFAVIRRGFMAMTVGVDGAPARRVQATAPPRLLRRPPATTTTTASAG